MSSDFSRLIVCNLNYNVASLLQYFNFFLGLQFTLQISNSLIGLMERNQANLLISRVVCFDPISIYLFHCAFQLLIKTGQQILFNFCFNSVLSLLSDNVYSYRATRFFINRATWSLPLPSLAILIEFLFVDRVTRSSLLTE